MHVRHGEVAVDVASRADGWWTTGESTHAGYDDMGRNDEKKGVDAVTGPRAPCGEAAVRCKVCDREVPSDEARSVEGRDYVWYFCGLDCYAEWRRSDAGRSS